MHERSSLEIGYVQFPCFWVVSAWAQWSAGERMHLATARQTSDAPRRGTRRGAAVLLAVALVVPATSAGAATKAKPKPVPPVCKLIVDPAGDAKGTGLAVSAPSSDPNLDII